MLRDLGDGLILRCANQQDAEALAQFQCVNQFGEDRPVDAIAVATRDLIKGAMPNFATEDWTVVEDSKSSEIVSALCLISQTWSYGGIDFPVGRTELVATHPDYRRRGLVRAQMQVVHQWSRLRREPVLAISGIPWYYRQFGYETALEYWGGRRGHPDAVPRLPDGQIEPFHVRSATEADTPLLARLYEQGMQRYLVSCRRDEDLWRYDLTVRSHGASHYHEVRVIESSQKAPVGILAHRAAPDARTTVYELEDGIEFQQVTPSVLRYLRTYGQQNVSASQDAEPDRLELELGSTHPAYEAASDALPERMPCYAWYVRVPDLRAFLMQIAPVLEQHLVWSTWARHTGVFHISFIRDGLRLTFEEGRITKIDNWQPPQFDSRYVPRIRDALFPGLTFLQLLFGYRSVEDLEHAFPDCLMSSNQARDILNALFPLRPSFVWGVE